MTDEQIIDFAIKNKLTLNCMEFNDQTFNEIKNDKIYLKNTRNLHRSFGKLHTKWNCNFRSAIFTCRENWSKTALLEAFKDFTVVSTLKKYDVTYSYVLRKLMKDQNNRVSPIFVMQYRGHVILFSDNETDVTLAINSITTPNTVSLDL